MPSIGFVGLGLMGLPVAERLAIDGGYRVHGSDIDPTRTERLDALGPNTSIQTDFRQMAATCPVIITCLAGEAVVQSVYEALCAHIGPDHWTIDISTVPPDLARATHDQVTGTGARHIEMPVIGIVDHGRAGTLHGLISGEGLEGGHPLPGEIDPIVSMITSSRTIAGGPGAASTMKVLQNALGLIQFVGIGEILGACESLGVSPRAFVDFVAAAPGMANSPLFQRIAPQMCDPDADPKTSRLAIAAKDARFGRDLMARAGARVDMAALSAALFAEAEQAGLGELDHIHIADLFRRTRSS